MNVTIIAKIAVPVAVALAALTSSTPAISATGCPAPIAVAHRGASNQAPEETGPALVAAARGGAGVVDLDVRWSRSNVPVLMHDATLDRTTNGTGYVSAYWLWQLRALDAGSWFSPGYQGTHIITLAEGLRLLARYPGVTAWVEPKGWPTDTKLRNVANAIASSPMAGRVAIDSFHSSVLSRFHTIAPSVPLGLITVTMPVKPVTLWLGPSNLTPEDVATAHAAGLSVWVWGDTPTEWERLSPLGIDGINTDRVAQYVGWTMAKCGTTP